MTKFKVGDRVRVKGVGPDSPMFDTGTIVGFTFGSAKVHWETADEIYTENASELEPIEVSTPSPPARPSSSRKTRSRR